MYYMTLYVNYKSGSSQFSWLIVAVRDHRRSSTENMTRDPIAVQIWAPNSFWERRTVLSKLMELKGRSWRSLLKGYLLSMSIRIINNFKLMVLRAQTELGALLWICFTPKYMLLIFVRKKHFDIFFAEKMSDFFFARFFQKKNRQKFLGEKKKYRPWSKT